MESLDVYYQTDLSKYGFLDRKEEILASHTLVFGAPKTGKSFLLIQHLNRFPKKRVLYIDLDDPRIDRLILSDNLAEFIQKNRILYLGLDGYDGSFPLPEVEHLFLTSSILDSLPEFETLHLYTLDFEEYVAFDTRHSDIIQSFNAFIKNGSLPEVVALPEYRRNTRIQELLQLVCLRDYEYLVFNQLIMQMGQAITVHQQFFQLKQHTKISKDKFYATCKELESREMIFFVPKHHQPNAPKKLYLYDHALKSAITFEKDFLSTIENMVFMELYKRGKRPFYLDGIDFYLPEEQLAIIDFPFATEQSLINKVEKIAPQMESLDIQKLICITVSFEKAPSLHQEISYEALPYWMWALGE